MSAYPNQGLLFPNDKKKSSTHPDWRGVIDINGEEFNFSAYEREGAKGRFLKVMIGKPVLVSPKPAT